MDWLRPCLDRAVRRWPWLASSWSLIWLAPWEKGLVPNHRISLCWWVLNWKVDFWLDWLESKNPRCHGVWSRYEPSPFGRVSDRSNLMTLSLNAPQGRAICLCAEPESHQGLRDLKVEMHVTKNIYTILFWTPVDCTPMGFRFEWLNHIISNGLVAASFKLSKTRNRNLWKRVDSFIPKRRVGNPQDLNMAIGGFRMKSSIQSIVIFWRLSVRMLLTESRCTERESFSTTTWKSTPNSMGEREVGHQLLPAIGSLFQTFFLYLDYISSLLVLVLSVWTLETLFSLFDCFSEAETHFTLIWTWSRNSLFMTLARA